MGPAGSSPAFVTPGSKTDAPLAFAAAGGWKDTNSLKSAYQHADPDTILRVVLSGGELKEMKG